ncbi:MAG: hypothetical protein Q8L10_04540 [Candidatus Moranbacteria bacterium]|nr:hypothetical protein [Candidatus Moranbacteria bacterium]
MTIRAYLWGMRTSTLVAVICLGLVIRYIDPIKDGLLGQVLFYVSLFFFVTGLATLFLFWIRRLFSKNETAYLNVGISFRQGLLVALAITAMFILQSLKLLIWWDAGLVIVAALLVELWFLSK